MNPTTSHQLILASASPRRRQLLARLGLPFTVRPSHIPEEVDAHLAPLDLVTRLARSKAEAVAASVESGLVIGADTIGALSTDEGEMYILGKPANKKDAQRMLRLLRGKRHQVVSGLAVIHVPSRRIETGTVVTQVAMRAYSDQEIEAYVASGEPMDKAAAYAIQGQAASLVEAIEGCYNNVVGFPLCELVALLQRFGVQVASANAVCRLPGGAPCPRTPL